MANLGAIGIALPPTVVSAPSLVGLIGFHTPGYITPPAFLVTVPIPPNIVSAPAFTGVVGVDVTRGSKQIIDIGYSLRGNQFFIGSGRSRTIGNPADSYALGPGAIWRDRLPVVPGARQVSIQVQQTTVGGIFHPVTFTVFSNPSIGLFSPLTATSISTTAWQTLGPLSFTATVNGGVEIQVYHSGHDPEIAYIDNLILL